MLESRRCVYCGAEATARDHIVPSSRGGSCEPDNIVPCCKMCNSCKNNRLPSEWLGERCPESILALERSALKTCAVLIPRRIECKQNPVKGGVYWGLRLLPVEIAALRPLAERCHLDLSVWMRMVLRREAGLPSLLDEIQPEPTTYEQSTGA